MKQMEAEGWGWETGKSLLNTSKPLWIGTQIRSQNLIVRNDTRTGRTVMAKTQLYLQPGEWFLSSLLTTIIQLSPLYLLIPLSSTGKKHPLYSFCL